MNLSLGGLMCGFVILLGSIIYLITYQSNTSNSQEAVINAYFEEIVFGNEWGTARRQLSKWEKPLYVCPMGDFSAELLETLYQITDELTLLTSLRLEIIQDSAKANCLIFAGKAQSYWQSIEPSARHLLKRNKGFFYIHLSEDKSIKRASILIDTSLALDLRVQKHLLREELTQVLGLVNDSWKYRDSIFYQGWTRTQHYSPLDKIIIKKLYQPQLRAGMTWKEIQDFL